MSNKQLILPFLLMALVFSACGVNIDLNIEQGSGNVITVTREVSNFDQLRLTGIGEVTLTQSDREELRIEAEDNLIEHLSTKVNNGVLEIGFDKRSVVPTKPVKFYLTMRDIHKLNTSGAVNVHSDKIDTDQLEIGVTGTGNINLQNVNASRLTVNISGAGNFDAIGQVDQLNINLSGAGNFNGQDFQSKNTEIAITGLGRVVVWASDSLKVIISGTGSVDYYGSPQVTQQISGLGRLTQKGEK